MHSNSKWKFVVGLLTHFAEWFWCAVMHLRRLAQDFWPCPWKRISKNFVPEDWKGPGCSAGLQESSQAAICTVGKISFFSCISLVLDCHNGVQDEEGQWGSGGVQDSPPAWTQTYRSHDQLGYNSARCEQSRCPNTWCLSFDFLIQCLHLFNVHHYLSFRCDSTRFGKNLKATLSARHIGFARTRFIRVQSPALWKANWATMRKYYLLSAAILYCTDWGNGMYTQWECHKWFCTSLLERIACPHSPKKRCKRVMSCHSKESYSQSKAALSIQSCAARM